MRILLIGSYYPEYLADLYAQDTGLASLPYDQQLRRIYEEGFAVSDAYAVGLNAAGCRVRELLVNADLLQGRWAADHGLSLCENVHDRRRQIALAQVAEFRPEVVYVFEWCPLGDQFLAQVKPMVRLLAGQVASPLHSNRTYAGYDLMVSSYPPLVDHFLRRGIAAEYLPLAFDPRILGKLPAPAPLHDLTFVGGFAPSHTDRIAWLEALIHETPVEIYGYGVERLPEDSPIHGRYRGRAWGRRMFEVLQQSRVTLNLHARIEIDGKHDDRFANNMRLYEATGVRTCLLTEAKSNLGELFDPSIEVATFEGTADCVEKIRYLLANEGARCQIAAAGQARTLRDHSYQQRMLQLAGILQRHLR